jgi:hypothetical protein
MLLVFVDETSDSKFKEYFGLCCATINSSFYRQIKEDFQHILVDGGWNPDVEFKGSYLFSTLSGDTQVSIEKRIEIASNILALNTSKQNARMKFTYLKLPPQQRQKDAYLEYLPVLLEKALPKAEKRAGKDILSLHCDRRDDITSREIYNAVIPIIRKRGYTLLEDIVISRSGFHTVGILYADIVGYLYARVDTIANDSELFENVPPEQWENNGKLKKLKSSTTLLGLIKKFDRYQVVLKQ